MTALQVSKIGSLLVLILLGWLLGRRAYLGQEAVPALARLLVDVTLPALIFVGLLNAGPSFFSAGWWVPVRNLPECDIRQVIDDLEAGKSWRVSVPRTFVVVDPGSVRIELGRCDKDGAPQDVAL